MEKNKSTCTDKNCPVHGKLRVHGRILTGLVVSDKMARSITVLIERRKLIRKFERYEKRYSKIKAHNPDCIGAVSGNLVRIQETRPISKTKSFVVIEVLNKAK